MLTFDKVCKQVTQVCGAHRGTVNQVIGGLLDVMVNSLDMGHSVELGEFGALRPSLRTRAQDELEAANAQAVYRRRINFVPGKMLKNFLKDVSVTRSPMDVVRKSAGTTDDDGKGEGDPGGGNPGDGEIVEPIV